MSKEKFKPVGMAIIVGTLAIATFLYLKSQRDSEVADDVEVVLPENAAVPEQTATNSEEKLDSTASGEAKPSEAPAVELAPAEKTPQEIFADEQKKLIETFKSDIRLQVNLPEDLHYYPLDLEDDVEGLHGVQGGSGDQKLTLLAARATGSPETIVNFLNLSKDSIPLIKENGFKINGEIQRLPPPKDSGIRAVTIIPGGEKSGRTTIAVHLERSDKLGSYLFIIEASPSYIDYNDDKFEAMLNSVKAK